MVTLADPSEARGFSTNTKHTTAQTNRKMLLKKYKKDSVPPNEDLQSGRIFKLAQAVQEFHEG